MLLKICLNNFFPLQHSFETFSHLKAIYSRDLGWLGETASSVRYPPFDGTNKGKYMSFLMQNRDTKCCFDSFKYILN